MITLEPCIFKFIEHELYSYDQTKRELAFMREEIIHGKQMPDVKVQNEPGDTTSTKALRLTTSTFILNAEKNINAIESALAILGEEHRELFRLKYQSRMPWKEVIHEMCISERTYFRTRRALVTMVGQKMGVINI